MRKVECWKGTIVEWACVFIWDSWFTTFTSSMNNEMLKWLPRWMKDEALVEFCWFLVVFWSVRFSDFFGWEELAQHRGCQKIDVRSIKMEPWGSHGWFTFNLFGCCALRSNICFVVLKRVTVVEKQGLGGSRTVKIWSESGHRKACPKSRQIRQKWSPWGDQGEMIPFPSRGQGGGRVPFRFKCYVWKSIGPPSILPSLVLVKIWTSAKHRTAADFTQSRLADDCKFQ